MAIVVFGLIIIVHECGHLITAKLSGVLVHEFTIGFGPAIFKFQKGETLYAIRLIPLGGAVVMESGHYEDSKESESEENLKTFYDEKSEEKQVFVDDDPRSFNNASLGKRMLITVAGALMNFILGILIIFFLMLPVKQVLEPQISGFLAGFPLESERYFQKGDIIREVNGYHIYLMSDLNFALSRNTEKEIDFTVERDGKLLELKDVPLEQREYLVDGQKTLKYGFQFTIRDLNFTGKISYTFKNAFYFARLVWVSLSELFTGGMQVSDMSGPVGISVAISKSAKSSLADMWYLVAFISINLGVMNLLPIPALDGGRLFFMLIELFRGKPINPKYENLVHMIGLGLFFLLFFYVTYNDIVRQFFS